MLTRQEFLQQDRRVRRLTADLQQDLARLRAACDVSVENAIREGAARLPAVELERQRAANAEDAARLALEAAIARRRQTDAAVETAKLEPRREEKRVRAASDHAIADRTQEYERGLDEIWLTYRRSHRSSLLESV